MAALVVVEASQRLFAPVPPVAGPMAWAAAVGIAINLLAARLFGSAWRGISITPGVARSMASITCSTHQQDLVSTAGQR